MNKNSAEYWYRLAIAIDKDIDWALANDTLTLKKYEENIKSMLYALSRKNVFVNPHWNTSLEKAFDGLFEMVALYFQNNSNAIIMLPMAVDLIVSGNKKHSYLTDFLVDIITVGMPDKKRFSKNMPPETPTDPREETGRQLGHINFLIDNMNMYAQQKDYLNALKTIEEIIPQIHTISQNTEGVIIIDLPAILNNKAYFNLQIGKAAYALEVIQNLIQKEPNFALAYHTQAEILEQMQRYNEAMISIDKAIVLEESEDKLQFKSQLLEKMSNI